MTATFTPAHHGGEGPPLVLIHGFTDTWRTWELVLPALERSHEVLAPTLPGHAGGPPTGETVDEHVLLDGIEAAMDAAGLATAHVAGNSLGGYLGLLLAARGRARTVTALAPAGGFTADDPQAAETLRHFSMMAAVLPMVLPRVSELVASPEGRRRATEFMCVNHDHLTADLVEHQILGAAACTATRPLVAHAERAGWALEPEHVTCPLRFVWGTEDRLLPWPGAAALYQEWFPSADWVVLDDVGHCIQLDVPSVAGDLIAGHAAG